MIKKILFSLICLLVIQGLYASVSAFTEEEKQNLKPQPGHIEQCKEGFPYLGVGDFNLTEANYSSAIKNNKALLVIVTAKWCDYCCKFEETFAEIKDTILTNKTLLHGVDVKLARAVVENNPTIEETVSKLPEFIFYYKEVPFIFEHSFEASTVGVVLSKIIKPYKVLSTPSEMQEYMDTDIQVHKADFSFSALKIIGLYSKEDDLKDELKGFKKLADEYAIYRDLQFALTTKENVISEIYKEKKSLWFPDYMRSTVLVIDRKHQVHKIDPTLDSEQMGNQIHWRGKEIVEPLTLETQELLRRMKQPILMSFLDPTKETAFQSYLSMLREVAKLFEGKLNFVYLDNNESANKRELLGILHDKVPAAGINFQNDPSLYPFPEDQEINKASLTKFARDFLDNKLVPLERKNNIQRVKPSERHPLYKTLSNVVEVRFGEFDDLVREEGVDVALLLFNPSEDKNLETFCKNYDKMAERFKALEIKSVRIAFYDLNSNPPPPSIQVFTSPMLVFLPAYQKRPPYKIYTDIPKTLSMMLYIEKYADVRFKLPDLPHLPPELHEEYYKQKKKMEEDKKKQKEKREDRESDDSSDLHIEAHKPKNFADEL